MKAAIMETITIDKDINVFYVTASSFPDGVLAAHQQLHSLVPFSTERKYFGISRPETNGGIVYHAAVEEKEPGEAEKYNCKSLVLTKGRYISSIIHNYMKHLPAIGNTFQEMIRDPRIDPQGYCVEWYISDTDVQCMVRLAD